MKIGKIITKNMGKLYLFSAKGAKRYYLTGSGWLAPPLPPPPSATVPQMNHASFLDGH